jgi:tetratricopeptide (TPR) repeat protein
MTASSEPGLRPERATVVMVRLGDKGRRGSGYLVAPGKVLTAAHVVEGAAGVQVRFEGDRSDRRVVDAVVEWAHTGIDVAVLAVPEDDVPLVSYGGLDEADAVVWCTALGFPRFKMRTNDDGSRYRDAEHAQARCAVLSNGREGTLDLTVDSPPAEDPDPRRDAWEGMSGAAAFSGGLLVGIVSRHHRGDGPGRIAASRVDRWAETLTEAERVTLEGLLGRRLVALPSVVPPSSHDLLQAAYLAQLAETAPTSLEERDAELADLASFCAGPDPYLWLQGAPWAGKTALAAWFALHPPRGVVPVWFFITARDTSQSDSNAYTTALIDQLAAVVGREPVATASPTARDGQRRLLLGQAADWVARNGRILLLVVDGLDEDQSLAPGGTGTSIASLLPERPPPNLRVLVTSRTNPGLPANVRGGHPLRVCPVVTLSATAASRHTEFEATYDLQQALAGDRLQHDLVGFLAAARGTLTRDDLRELTGAPAFEVRQRLDSAFGRILRLRGDAGIGAGQSGPEGYDGDTTLHASTRGYLFAHETLLAAAQDGLGPDLGGYLDRLHTWAKTYEERGWPEDTPAYLLQPYARLTALLGDLRRLTALAVHVGRRERLRDVTGSDAAYLAELATAREAVRRTTPDDLGALAALTAAEGFVAERNSNLHPDIPVAYARMGRVRRAIGLARSVSAPLLRARALADVACVLAGARDRRALRLAEEAVQLTERTVADQQIAGNYDVLLVLGRLITVLAGTHGEDEALRRLGEFPDPQDDAELWVTIQALVATAVELRGAASAAGLLQRAEELVPDLTPLPPRIRLMAQIAEAWEALGDTANAPRIYDAMAQVVREEDDLEPSALAAFAEALRGTPGLAEDIARRAADEAADLLRTIPSDGGDAPEWDETRSEAVVAFASAGRLDEATSVMWELRRLQLEKKIQLFTHPWHAIAGGWARAGQVAEAWDAYRFTTYGVVANDEVEDDRPAASLAHLLAESGFADETETHLLGISAPDWSVAEALAGLAGHFLRRDAERALRLLNQAERYCAHDDHVSVVELDELICLVDALARAGLPDEAERLVPVMRSSDYQARGYALVAHGVAHVDPGRAVRLAERAISESLSHSYIQAANANTLTTAVRAMTLAGATARTLRAVDEVFDSLHRHRDYDHDLIRLSAAEGLWVHDPAAAGELIDAVLDGRHARAVRGLAETLASVGPHDPRRSDRIHEMLRRMDAAGPLSFPDEVLMSVLTGSENTEAARQRLRQAIDGTNWSGKVSVVLALAHAALGDFASAEETARSQGGSRAYAELAAYAACVDGPLARTAPLGPGVDNPMTIRHMAATLFPPPDGPDLPRARTLLTKALTPRGWQHALPVLAAIDPDAAHGVPAVVLAQRGLGG